MILAPTSTLELGVGQRLRVAILQDQASRAGFPVPRPSSPVLRVVAHRPELAVYLAVRRGSGRLLVHSRFCELAKNRIGTCVVLLVRVR